MPDRPKGPLRRGWTTGACATAAASAAYHALLGGEFPDPVVVTLPKGQRPAFALAREELGKDFARAAVIKDAGDDPDVTHGALVIATLRRNQRGHGVTFKAGPGVGTVTLPGLPVPPGEPAINPAPRAMMRAAMAEIAATHGEPGDVEIEISIPDGESMAKKTWNPRLGITGGLSILGTTGIVVPYSCSAWIHSIHSGIDVARASNLSHVAACTGSTSERVVQAHYGLSDTAMLDMGDFAGGLLKYLRRHPLPRLTIGGGFAKLTKLGAGHLDLHSGRSQVDMDWLAERLIEASGTKDLVVQARAANTANQVLDMARAEGLALGDLIARLARSKALEVLGGGNGVVVDGSAVAVDVLIVDREGDIVGRADD